MYSLHPEENALLQAILRSPEDDLPRYALIDWQLEHGRKWGPEFISVQLELEKHRRNDAIHCRVKPGEVFKGLGLGVSRRRCRCIVCKLKKREYEAVRNCHFSGGSSPSIGSYDFRRGFRWSYYSTVGSWAINGPGLVACEPIGKLDISGPWFGTNHREIPWCISNGDGPPCRCYDGVLALQWARNTAFPETFLATLRKCGTPLERSR